MTERPGIVMRRGVAILLAAGLVAAGAVASYLIMRRPAPPARAVPATRTEPEPRALPSSEVAFTLSKEAVARSGIEVDSVRISSGGGQIRVPAVVEPNAYRSVVVTSLVAGRVTHVSAELGRQVRRGETLAQVYSPELAEAQSRYLASLAELEAHARELRRTQQLAEIGAASRQELERVHAEHTAATTEVQTRRSRLTLLGMSSAAVEKLTPESLVTSTTNIAAPIDGVVTARQANVGLNIDPATPLFTVVDLATVWLVGDLYERDFPHVRVGSAVRVTTTAYPELLLQGRISYIDPEINPTTRTARLRVEVPNPGRQLRLGMYAEMQAGDAAPAQRTVIPRAAVQMVGNRSVVYLADQMVQGRFIERDVELGDAVDDSVEVAKGLQPGDRIAVKGSFALRAERDRLGLGMTPRVVVSEKGFEPARVSVRAGSPVRITFVRTTDATCATEITVPAFDIRRPLPLNQPVDIEFTPTTSGNVEFVCGMGMLRGVIVVE